MKGVISPGVSAGSKYVGASEMCTAQLIEPSGSAMAEPAGASASVQAAAASTAIRTRRMRSALMAGLFPCLERLVADGGRPGHHRTDAARLHARIDAGQKRELPGGRPGKIRRPVELALGRGEHRQW